MNERDERLNLFLKKLMVICAEFGATIDSCGHCDSPYGDFGDGSYDALFVSPKRAMCRGWWDIPDSKKKDVREIAIGDWGNDG